MRELTLSEIQKESLNILLDVHCFCSANGIRYSLAYGSLIGAVRHKGFIPWDDDIDIIMPRPDYERFCSSYSSKCYKLICSMNDNGCMMAFAKVCDTLKTVDTNISWTKQEVGLGIDVFPIDGAEDDYSAFVERYGKMERLWRKTYRFREIQFGIQERYSKRTKLLISFLDLIHGHWIVRKLARITINQMENTAKKIKMGDTGHCTMMVFCDDGIKSYYKAQSFEKIIQLPFEGYSFCAFEGYDDMLTALFGDYMQLPPVDQRVSNHEFHLYWK